MISVKPKRPKAEPTRQPTLFEMEKLEKTAETTSQPKIERPYRAFAFVNNHFSGFAPATVKLFMDLWEKK